MIGTIKKQAKDLKAELDRVDWPGREKVMSSTWIVVVISIFVGVFLWVADLVLSKVFAFLFPGH